MDDQNLSSEQPYAERPNTLRNLRACRMCKLIKSYIQVRYSNTLRSPSRELTNARNSSSSSRFVTIAGANGLMGRNQTQLQLVFVVIRSMNTPHPILKGELRILLLCLSLVEPHISFFASFSQIAMMQPSHSWVSRWLHMRT